MSEPDAENESRSRAGAIAAIVIAVVLIAVGLWIAQALIGMVRQQNCAMSGRRDCLDLPAR